MNAMRRLLLAAALALCAATAQAQSDYPNHPIRFIVGFALTTGFFALAMAAFQARYLPLFGRLVHPTQWMIWRR